MKKVYNGGKKAQAPKLQKMFSEQTRGLQGKKSNNVSDPNKVKGAVRLISGSFMELDED